MENIKYSFCTTCMDRLEHLSKTIFNNLRTIESYQNAELILVNYDSKRDDIDEFVDKYLSFHITKGYLTYISVLNKERFYHSHAKNIAHINSFGNFLINVDADNFLTEKYVKLLDFFFEKNKDSIIRGTGNTGGYGRIAISRENFIRLGGYNEKLIYYGGEDTDLIERAERYLNCKSVILQPKEVLHISHDDVLRKQNIGDENIKTSYKKNRKIMDYYLKNNIINPNEYEKIDCGKI